MRKSKTTSAGWNKSDSMPKTAIHDKLHRAGIANAGRAVSFVTISGSSTPNSTFLAPGEGEEFHDEFFRQLVVGSAASSREPSPPPITVSVITPPGLVIEPPGQPAVLTWQYPSTQTTAETLSLVVARLASPAPAEQVFTASNAPLSSSSVAPSVESLQFHMEMEPSYVRSGKKRKAQKPKA